MTDIKKRVREMIRDAVDDTNMAIFDSYNGQDSPVWLQSRNVAKVKIRNEDMKRPKTYKVKRKDVYNYSQGLGTGFGKFGGIVGDWRPVMYLKQDVQGTFAMLDENLEKKGVRIKRKMPFPN